jgi:hypothetical protein
MIVGAALRYRLCFATSLSPVPYQARLNPSLSVFDRDPLPFCAVARPWMRTRSASPRRRGRRGGRGSPREDDGLRRNIGAPAMSVIEARRRFTADDQRQRGLTCRSAGRRRPATVSPADAVWRRSTGAARFEVDRPKAGAGRRRSRRSGRRAPSGAPPARNPALGKPAAGPAHDLRSSYRDRRPQFKAVRRPTPWSIAACKATWPWPIKHLARSLIGPAGREPDP